MPRTITEKCEQATRAAPRPATGPSAAAITGISLSAVAMTSQVGLPGTYVRPVISYVFTLPPPPVPSTSLTSGSRNSRAIFSA